ncbi:hypothetical protein ST201phi2-1p033 [Pseudomonas phage 201phi2-1]|uniref:Uncharacterized protein n=1 Tax=Pseudomonas phage 201phi2-1 TaxID=198110 RepID=B3FK08_BP201|nr:hypothetical protein ST201phi2-1p033 [Pseudomonas phage 201phi2-1]ABY62866.1 hypothetical protein 201phi2-1p033 [Pseudomonas phage 201phi2-1]
MANTYPLKPLAATQYKGTSPSAVTDEAAKYKDMLGFQAASVDVGLFYQLNQAATGVSEVETANGSTVNGQTPIEANAMYA